MTLSASLPPTARRIREARRDGNVPRSRQLATASVLLVGWGALALQIPVLVADLGHLAQLSFAMAATPTSATSAGALLWQGLGDVGMTLVAPLGVLWVATALIGMLQVGPTFTGRPLRPDPSRLDPARNLQAIARAAHPADLLLQTVRVATILGLTLHYLIAVAPRVIAVTPETLGGGVMVVGDLVFGLGWRLALAMFLLGLADYAWQRTRWFHALHMTRHELDQERRDAEGDPVVRRERDRLRHTDGAQGGLETLAESTLTLSDGASRLIALRWREGTAEAPRVCARGQDTLAATLLAEARRLGRPVVVHRPLTTSLWAVRLGDPIPPSLFAEVARLLVATR